jgi:hypothetical protein
MPRYPGNAGSYEVSCSGVIGRSLKIQKQAKAQGRGEAALSAIRTIWHRLSIEPTDFGEPLYRLPALRLQVRHGANGPLLIYFAVHEDKPVVFIKGAILLPE